jgi:hypothetical protein
MRTFDLSEARALLPEARRRVGEVAAMVEDLRTTAAEGAPLADVKALDASIHDELDWFTRQGIQVKGVAPALLDFPAEFGGREILLCWLDGEDDITHYHDADAGFAGRAPLSDLGLV